MSCWLPLGRKFEVHALPVKNPGRAKALSGRALRDAGGLNLWKRNSAPSNEAFPSSLVRRGWAVSAGRSPKTQPCRGRVSGQMGPILSLGGAPVASRRLLDEGRTPLRRRRLNFDPAAYLLRVASRLRPSHAPTRPPGPACPTHPARRAPRARRRSRAEVGARRRRSTSAARGVSRGLFERSQERRRSPWPWARAGPGPCRPRADADRWTPSVLTLARAFGPPATPSRPPRRRPARINWPSTSVPSSAGAALLT